MGNQKGEVVTAVMVLMMVGMMIFGGMALSHRDRGERKDRHGHHMKEDGHDHSEKDQQQTHDSGANKAMQPSGGEEGK